MSALRSTTAQGTETVVELDGELVEAVTIADLFAAEWPAAIATIVLIAGCLAAAWIITP